MADEAPVSAKLDVDALGAVLVGPFSDPTARQRREHNLGEDPRPDAALTEIFGPLDAFIAALPARLDRLAEAPVPAEPEAGVADTQRLKAHADAAEAAAPPVEQPPTVRVTPDPLPDAPPPPPPAVEAPVQAEKKAEEPPSLPPVPVPPAAPVHDDDLAGAAEATTGQPPELAATQKVPQRKTPKRKRVQRSSADLLYEDMLWLLSINDGEGALISLERLLASHPIAGELQQFIELNHERLLNLYKGTIFGDLDKVPTPVADPGVAKMPPAYQANEKINAMFGLVDGRRTIAKLVEVSDLTALESCCVLNQLRRAGLVTIA